MINCVFVSETWNPTIHGKNVRVWTTIVHDTSWIGCLIIECIVRKAIRYLEWQISVVSFELTEHASHVMRSLQWRLNERDGVSNYQRPDCLRKRLSTRRSKGGPVNSPHKGPATPKIVPFDDVIMDDPLIYGYRNLQLLCYSGCKLGFCL